MGVQVLSIRQCSFSPSHLSANSVYNCQPSSSVELLSILWNCFPPMLLSVENCWKLTKKCSQYACCVKCNEVYPLDDCVERTSSKCSHISFPNHPHGVHRLPCGALLMKEVQMGSKLFFYPFKTFCYRSIIESVRELCAWSGFLQKCESWRNRVIEDGVFMDIYDGHVWKDFMAPSGLNFFGGQ